MNHFLSFHRKVALYGPHGPLEWLFFLFLLPAAILYGVIGWARICCYQFGIFSTTKVDVPVVSVGNLVAGGTGKTPVVDWLVKAFVNQGKRPVVVSRGYGGAFEGRVGIVSGGSGLQLNAEEAGDEPVLLALKNPSVPVLIARKRAAGVRKAVEDFTADVVVLDDCFQHRAVQRDIDLVLLDAKRPCGNRWPLPAGLLREFPSALKRADLLLLTRSDGADEFSFADKPVFVSRHKLVESAVSLAGENVVLSELQGKKLFAFAGIAVPESFFSALKTLGLQLEGTLALQDHCRFDRNQQEAIQMAALGCDALITTEKDIVKISDSTFTIPCFAIPMIVQIENETAFKNILWQRLWRESE